MTTTPHHPSPVPFPGLPPAPAAVPHRIQSPLRLQWLGRRLAGRPGAEEAMRRALDIDARMRQMAERVSRPELIDRAEVLTDLVRLRVELDAVVHATLGEPPEEAAGLAALDPELRVRLAELLGVPLAPEFYPLLELKAAEYFEQGRAFDQVASDFGFVEGSGLGPQEARGALILTHNGSLVQMSAPGAGGDPTARRFVYQNIYGGRMPTEGTLRLRRRVAVGHRVRTNHMETSPVRKLQLAVRPDGWERQRETFRSLSLALAPQPAPRTMWGAHPGWHPAVLARSVAMQRVEAGRARLDQAAMAARAELREHLLVLADPSRPAGDAVLEADILGLCIHLQRLAAEGGQPGHRAIDVCAFVTDRGERCTFEQRGGEMVAMLERPSRAPVTIAGVTLAGQLLVRGAPVAMVDGTGGVAAMLGDVVHIELRGS